MKHKTLCKTQNKTWSACPDLARIFGIGIEGGGGLRVGGGSAAGGEMQFYKRVLIPALESTVLEFLIVVNISDCFWN